MITMRDAFFDEIYKIAQIDRDVMIVSADFSAPSLNKFVKDFPNQYVNVGIAEQSMITLATGLALEGKKVFVYAIMPFVTLRCFELIKVDVSLMNIPMRIVGVGAGFSYEESGATHHSTEDISVMRVLPNLTILSPSDSIMAGEFAKIACQMNTPVYIRLDRKILPTIYRKGTNFSDGLTKLKDGETYIIATGNMVHRALEVSEKIGAGVIDLYKIKPINERLLLDSISKAKRVVTLEEHLLAGGLGSIVAEIFTDNNVRIPLKRIGVHDKYYYLYGGRSNIQSILGLDENSVTKTITEWVK